MPDQSNATVQITRNTTIQALVEELFAKPSGVYLVTVHNRQVTKVAPVDREKILACDAPAEKGEGESEGESQEPEP